MPPRGRTARLTWVNFVDNFANSVTDGSFQAVDVLGSAQAFQKSDATIVKVIGSIEITHVALGAVPSEDFEDFLSLYVAEEGITATDLPDQNTPGDQAAYLWTGYAAGRRIGNTGAGGVADPSLHLTFPLNVNAMRRFREDGKTLWLIVRNSSGTGESLLWSAYIRTLLRTP